MRTMIGATVLAFAFSQHPLSASPALSRFTESTSVVAVEIPVQVVANGEPVRGLGVDNFEVFSGRTKQTITSFEVLDLKVAAAGPQPVAAALRRHFLFFFDLSFSEPESLLKARAAARELVVKNLHPTDFVAVASYHPSKGARVLLGFTADRRQARYAIDNLAAPQLLNRNADPLRLALAEVETSAVSSVSGGRPEIIEELRESAARSESVTRQEELARAAAMTRSLADLARLMAPIQGRKHVVYLSEGFDTSLLVGAEGGDSPETRRAIESGQYWTVDSEKRFGSGRMQDDLEHMLDEFRRADCVIQAVDIGGLRAPAQLVARPSGEGALLLMAKDTGGDLYKNFNDLGQAMGQMLERTSVTYVLTFQPEVEFDGRYHRLDVRLKGAPRGARVVHRPGYYAPKPFSQQAAVERQLAAAGAIVGGRESGSLDVSLLAVPFPVKHGKAYVPVLVDVSGPSLLAGLSGDVATIEFYLYAFDEAGAVHDFVAQSVGLDLKKAPPSLRKNGLRFFAHLDLAAGSYSLRSFTRNGQTGSSALRVAAVTVTPLEGAPSLLPPLVPEDEGRWWILRETAGANEQVVDYPFTLGKSVFVPATRPVLSVSTQFVIVGTQMAGMASLTLQLVDFTGKKVAALPVSELRRAPGEVDRLAGRVDPSLVPPGLYAASLVATVEGQSVRSSPLTIEVARP